MVIMLKREKGSINYVTPLTNLIVAPIQHNEDVEVLQTPELMLSILKCFPPNLTQIHDSPVPTTHIHPPAWGSVKTRLGSKK